MTRREKLIAALEARGAKRVASSSSRYVVLTHYKIEGRKFFIGENGALRAGPNATTSVSLTDTKGYKDLLTEGAAILSKR